MSNGPIRRSQLISPFGVGALYVGRDGVSLISAGLDHWFEQGEGSVGVLEDEFKISEWRLERALQVDHFRMPADHRRALPYQSEQIPNISLYQPFLRFPRWHYCQDCRVLDQRPLTEQGRIFCRASGADRHQGRNRPMTQAPYIAVCPRGHIQDFPWREWVHRTLSPPVSHQMQLISKGSAGLGSEWIECECGNSRSLGTILNSDKTSGEGLLSTLATQAGPNADDAPYLCQGHTPWLGTEDGSECGEQLSGALRGASNVYFATTRSSIYIPRLSDVATSELVSLIEDPMIKALMQSYTDLEARPPAQQIRNHAPVKFMNFTDEQIAEAVGMVLAADEGAGATGGGDDEDSRQRFLREEFTVIREPKKEQDLEIRSVGAGQYEAWVPEHFEKIMLVDKLRETRALVGFTRLYEENDMSQAELKSMLRAKAPSHRDENWLPAYNVFGEGIFFEFKESLVLEWETRPDVISRLNPLIERYIAAQIKRHSSQIQLSPRYVMLHTFAHVLINSLTFECGYSSASLRERLYVSDDPERPMAGVLIYTASGDADGTMGGLVRMGKPGFLEPVIKSALVEAKWCSADPICMEVGAAGGQGPDSCNLAACHNCALVPETSCEIFNKILDRATIIGALDGSPEGIFTEGVFGD